MKGNGAGSIGIDLEPEEALPPAGYMEWAGEQDALEAAAVALAAEAERIEAAASRFDDGLARQAVTAGEMAAAAARIEAAAAGRAVRLDAAQLVVPVTEFIGSFVPHRDVVTDLLRAEYVYALTAPTNAGKTALLVHLMFCVARGAQFHGRNCRRGRVLYLCGENPNDLKPRMLRTCQILGLDPGELAGWVDVVPSAFHLEDMVETLIADAGAAFVGEDGAGPVDSAPFVLVVVDTSAAYNFAESEDDNQSAKRHALACRALTRLPGSPAVVVACHPRKHATKDELEPRGGSAFLAEVDGNLVCFQDGDEGLVRLGWQKKLRQPAFEPIEFRLLPSEVEGVEYEDGSPYVTVTVAEIGEREAEGLIATGREDENLVLLQMLRHGKKSLGDWARLCGWHYGVKAVPNKQRVARVLQRLLADALVRKYRGGWVLSERGKKEAERFARGMESDAE